MPMMKCQHDEAIWEGGPFSISSRRSGVHPLDHDEPASPQSSTGGPWKESIALHLGCAQCMLALLDGPINIRLETLEAPAIFHCNLGLEMPRWLHFLGKPRSKKRA